MKSSILSADQREQLAALLFPDADTLPDLEELEAKYPPRDLPSTALVTRVAPSPTGNAHIGLVYTSLVNKMLAKQSNGLFLLRIEDTDSSREIKGAFDTIVQTLRTYDLEPDEGLFATADGTFDVKGSYGPYVQSQRRLTYRAAVRKLVLQGLAYPCFCESAELEQLAQEQRASKVRPGYWGSWARWRDQSLASIVAELEKGKKPAIRLRSFGLASARTAWNDLIKGTLKLPENDLDTVILKSDGQSLYHLAHLVDDHFMRITTVVRGDEWVSSVPLHIQLYQALGWTPPTFGHLATIQTTETVLETDEVTGETKEKIIKRKLSKRKDPEASADYYIKCGFPQKAVNEYLLNLANSTFEEWRKKNPTAPMTEFPLRLDKFNSAGALADTVKLTDISREVVSRMTAEEVLASATPWLHQYAQDLGKLTETHRELTLKALGVERGGAKPNKRIAMWVHVEQEIAWAIPELFEKREANLNLLKVSREDLPNIVKRLIVVTEGATDRDAWFEQCKGIASEFGYAPEVKAFKAAPESFKGHVGDVTMILRVLLCRSNQTPDLFEVAQVLGIEEVKRRLGAFFSEN